MVLTNSSTSHFSINSNNGFFVIMIVFVFVQNCLQNVSVKNFNLSLNNGCKYLNFVIVFLIVIVFVSFAGSFAETTLTCNEITTIRTGSGLFSFVFVFRGKKSINFIALSVLTTSPQWPISSNYIKIMTGSGLFSFVFVF